MPGRHNIRRASLACLRAPPERSGCSFIGATGAPSEDACKAGSEELLIGLSRCPNSNGQAKECDWAGR